MDIEGLRQSPIGQLVPIRGSDARWGAFDYFAFAPSALPEAIPLTESTGCTVADAAMALGRLDVAAERVPNPLLLVRPALRKEAVSTSALEGTFAPLTEVLEGEIVGTHAVSREAAEILNYIRAADHAFARLAQVPVSFNLLAELQKILVSGTRGDSYDAGMLRQRQVFIGPERGPIERARYVPPPPGDELANSVADWERWIHSDTAAHLLVKVALGHYQFEALHPFSDGNGRLGRLVVALQLMESGVLRYPLLNIAEWLEPRRDEYQDNLLKLSIDGDYDHWVGFFCRGVEEQARAATDRINRLLSLRESLLLKVRESGSRGGAAYRIADELIGFPVLDVPWTADRHGVTYQAAKESLGRLEQLGVLRLVKRPTGRLRNLYISDDVLRELER